MFITKVKMKINAILKLTCRYSIFHVDFVFENKYYIPRSVRLVIYIVDLLRSIPMIHNRGLLLFYFTSY